LGIPNLQRRKNRDWPDILVNETFLLTEELIFGIKIRFSFVPVIYYMNDNQPTLSPPVHLLAWRDKAPILTSALPPDSERLVFLSSLTKFSSHDILPQTDHLLAICNAPSPLTPTDDTLPKRPSFQLPTLQTLFASGQVHCYLAYGLTKQLVGCCLVCLPSVPAHICVIAQFAVLPEHMQMNGYEKELLRCVEIYAKKQGRAIVIVNFRNVKENSVYISFFRQQGYKYKNVEWIEDEEGKSVQDVMCSKRL